MPFWQAAKSEPQGNMCLAGTTGAKGDDIFTALNIFATRQIGHQKFVERRNGFKLEAVRRPAGDACIAERGAI